MAVIVGTEEADVLQGDLHGQNDMSGRNGGDILLAGYEDDTMEGGSGDDVLWAAGGNDQLSGGTGFDVLYGSDDNDALSGGEGNDLLSGGKDDDLLLGGKDNDVLQGNSGDDVMFGNSGDDYLFGHSGNDMLNGGSGNDVLDGGSGDDTLMASTGNDQYVGGSGFDTLDFSNVASDVMLDLSAHTMTFTANGNDFASSVAGFERVVGGSGNLHVMGNSGDTEFVGGAGDDWFRGKGGADVFTGGEGSDTFAWLKKDVTDGKGVDIITDFEAGVDRLDMADFVKGGQAYEDVVRIVDNGDGEATVQGFAWGAWFDVAHLDGLDAASTTLDDLGLMRIDVASTPDGGSVPASPPVLDEPIIFVEERVIFDTVVDDGGFMFI